VNTATARVRDREASERRIRDAAVSLFAQHGYDQVTVRMIATEARVNVALISRYFGSKLNLFTAVVAAGSQLPDLAGVAPAELPRRLAGYAVRPHEERPILRALSRSSGSAEVREVLHARLEDGLVRQIAAVLDAPDALRRARVAAAMLIGTAMARGLFGPPDLPDDDLADRLTAVLRTCLLD
jgi:AcrR family transcriptional regulator